MAIGAMRNAIAINLTFAQAHLGLGWAYHYGDSEAEQAMPHYDAALRLSQRSPSIGGHSCSKVQRFAFSVITKTTSHIAERLFRPLKPASSPICISPQHWRSWAKGEAQTSVKSILQLEPRFSIHFVLSKSDSMHAPLKSLLDSPQKAGCRNNAWSTRLSPWVNPK